MGLETAVYMMVAASAVSAYGQMQSAKAQSAALNYNAKVAENNAIMARDKANYEAERQASRMRRIIASQRVAYSSNGIVLGDTAMDLMLDTTTQGEMDRLAILYGGDVESVNYQAQAASSRMQARATQIAGMYGAAGTLIGGSANALYTYRYGQSLGIT